MKRNLILVFLALIGLIALSRPAVFAKEFDLEDINTENKYSDRGYLIVTPNRLRFNGVLEPGNTYTAEFTAVNIGGKPISFNLTTEAYGVQNESYKPIYSEPTNRTKISEWITFPGGTEFTLEPQAGRHKCDDCAVDITVRVRVPKDAVGGGQYAAVMANIVPSGTNTGSFQALARIALTIFSTINGDITYKGDMINHQISTFSFAPIITTSSTVENYGNADFQASYRLLVESIFGGKVAYDKTEEKIIFPETKRVYEQNWDGAPALGVFNVTQAITYINESGEQITDTFKRVTIICPLWFIIIIIAFIATIVTSAAMNKKRRKMKKNHKKPSWDQP